ncbi:MAG: efflux RND transporter periplasmic adaptor subunit [Alicyclobacillaceae bacterium]|nr:efflux RND transporter periplasmic adaptor subunit [Alicyclobacillaceae bacterium]
MKTWVKGVLFLGVPLGGFLLVLSGALTQKIPPGTAERAAAKIGGVQTAPVEPAPSRTGVTVPGTVVADGSSQIASKVMASVQQVMVKEGDFVKQGQTLVVLNPEPLAAAVRQAEAGSRQAEAGVQAAQAVRAQIEEAVRQAQAGLQAARANLQSAEADWKRTESLYEAGAASRQDYDHARARYQSAQAQYDQAQAALQGALAQKAEAEARLGQAQAQLTQAQASVQAAAANLSDTVLKAPFDGFVTAKMVHEGDMATPGMPLLTVERGPYALQVFAEEKLAASVKPGDAVPVHIPALGQTATGVVVEIAPRIDPASRTFKMKIRLPGELKVTPGMFGEATLGGGEAQVLYIPKQAVVRWSQFTGVYAVDDQGRAHLRYVSLGRESGDRVEVLSGLNAGERIVVSGVDRVTDGAEVGNRP